MAWFTYLSTEIYPDALLEYDMTAESKQKTSQTKNDIGLLP